MVEATSAVELYTSRARRDTTKKSYASHEQWFFNWCHEHDAALTDKPLDEGSLCQVVASFATTHKPASVKVFVFGNRCLALAAIRSRPSSRVPAPHVEERY
jgi:hypothetical protein